MTDYTRQLQNQPFHSYSIIQHKQHNCNRLQPKAVPPVCTITVAFDMSKAFDTVNNIDVS